jgi:hypothetical protein
MRSTTQTRSNRPPRLTVEVPPALLGELVQLAQIEDRPLGNLVRRLLVRALETERRPEREAA